MNPDQLKHRIRGVLAFSPTPFTADDQLDTEGLAQHIDFLCRSGVHVVVVCGGVGEFFALDNDEYRACVQTAVRAAAGRVPVIAGVGHATKIACRLAAYAEEAGADGLMINPLYFVEPSEEGLHHHYLTLSRATSLGMIAFSTRGMVYTPAMLQRLADVSSVIALKDEHGDLKLFIESIELLGDRMAWINGMAETLAAPYFAAGAGAITSGLVNFVPALTLAIWEAGVAQEWASLRHLVSERVRPLARLRERRRGYHITVLKEAMNMLGMPGGSVRSPLLPLLPQDREELRAILKGLGLQPV